MNKNPMRIALLGASGSVGMQTLEVIRKHPELFELEAFSLGSNINTAMKIADEFAVSTAVVCDISLYAVSEKRGLDFELLFGEEHNEYIAQMQSVDCVVIAMPGMAAIIPLIAAIKSGKRLAVANKECIVSGGKLIQDLLKEYNTKILPIDSEQSAIFQCLEAISSYEEVDKLILTASGGPFRNSSLEEMSNATVEEALAHPRWSMGKKISIDSATLVNKGLEVIEAAYLFGFEADKIEVLIHPQSIVHSMIECCDGALLAQLGTANMTLPIQYALTYPNRIQSPAKRLDFSELTTLEFHLVDLDRFRGLSLAYDALRAGNSAPAVYNAADEIAVDAFLDQKIGLLDIVYCIEETLQRVDNVDFRDIEELFEIDLEARRVAMQVIKQLRK